MWKPHASVLNKMLLSVSISVWMNEDKCDEGKNRRGNLVFCSPIIKSNRQRTNERRERDENMIWTRNVLRLCFFNILRGKKPHKVVKEYIRKAQILRFLKIGGFNVEFIFNSSHISLKCVEQFKVKYQSSFVSFLSDSLIWF